MKPIYLMAFLLASPLSAETCPEPQDISAPLAALLNEAHQASSDAEGQAVSQKMWQLWAAAPNAQAQDLLDTGMSRRASYDFLGALEAFDRLVAYCPDYAEGYNQRAFVNFLRHDFAAALPDLDKALDLSPAHVAAMSGRALTLLALGQVDAAREDMDRALALNPWIPERGLVAPGGPLAPVEQDI